MADFLLLLSDDRLNISSPEKSVPSLGLMYLASALEDNGFSVAIRDLRLELEARDKEDVLLELIKEFSPKAVGVSILTFSAAQAYETARIIRKHFPKILLIAGGIHPTFVPNGCLGFFDIVVRGYGEKPIVNIGEYLEGRKKLGDIPGISYNEGGKCVHNESGEMTPPCGIPAWHLASVEKYSSNNRFAIITGRGCPFLCNYCTCSAISNKRYFPREMGSVLEEIRLLIGEYGAKQITFLDDTFTLDRKRAIEVCRAIGENGLHFGWSCYCRVDTVDAELLEAMKNAGCKAIHFGVESGNRKILFETRKGITLEQAEAAVATSKAAGISEIICSFIIGHAKDTEETIVDTVAFACRLKELGATVITVSMLIPYPGSEVWDKRKELGIKVHARDWNFTHEQCAISTKNLSRENIEFLYYNFVLPYLNPKEVIAAAKHDKNAG